MTAILFTIGSAAFMGGCIVLLFYYFGEHPPRPIPLLSQNNQI